MRSARFVVESVKVRHIEEGGGRIAYPVRLVLRGSGGQQGALRALKALRPAPDDLLR